MQALLLDSVGRGVLDPAGQRWLMADLVVAGCLKALEELYSVRG